MAFQYPEISTNEASEKVIDLVWKDTKKCNSEEIHKPSPETKKLVYAREIEQLNGNYEISRRIDWKPPRAPNMG